MASDRFWLVPLQVLIVLGLLSAASAQPDNSFLPYDIEHTEDGFSDLSDYLFFPLEYRRQVHKRETNETTTSDPHGVSAQTEEPAHLTPGNTLANTNSSVVSTEQTRAAGDGVTEKAVKDKDDSKKMKEESSDKNADNKLKHKKFTPSATEKSVTPDNTDGMFRAIKRMKRRRFSKIPMTPSESIF